MKLYQAVAFLFLVSTDAFIAPCGFRSGTVVSDTNSRGDSTILSRRIWTKNFLQKFDIDRNTITSTKEEKQISLPKLDSNEIGKAPAEAATIEDDNALVQFAKEYPFLNNFIIASLKTCAADVLAQTAIAHTPILEIDVQRSLLFCAFGGLYSGAFQYLYQVQVFKKLFDVDKFTTQSWSEKLKDTPGLKALVAQTGLDLTILTIVYLPAFYIFKASVFSGSGDPTDWFSSGVDTYSTNFGKDEADLLKVWLPADLVCFSVPLYLRMPVRQSVSFLWTVYLSFARGGH